ncbi:hypothetical protein [Nannocystis pusilla]|uniref:hypothetical protein n=1 Tax=Nannocystis pusilla TaxID=889268 RepID=UPI003DA634BC
MSETVEPPPASQSARNVISAVALLALVLALPRALALPRQAETLGYLAAALMMTVVLPLAAGWIRLKWRPDDHAGAQRVVVVTALIMLGIRVVTFFSAL